MRDVRVLLDQSNEGIWFCEIKDPIARSLPSDLQIPLILERGVLVECNDAMAGMYGFAKSSTLIGLPFRQILVPDPSHQQIFLRKLIENDYRILDVETVEKDGNGNMLS